MGVWYQQKRSDEETRLLVSIWEKLVQLDDDIDFLMSSHEEVDMLFKEMRVTQELDLEVTQPINTRHIS